MTRDQMKDEIKNVAKLFDEIYSTFGLSYQIELSTMPEDHMGDEKIWHFARRPSRPPSRRWVRTSSSTW